jgi:DNA topoisomerase VI subunit B
MPCEVSIYPEPYAPSGNIGDGGLRKLLGAPSLNSLQMVIRESVQNSCDAAKLGIGPTVLIRIRTLNPAQISILRDTVFLELPDNGESKKKTTIIPGIR